MSATPFPEVIDSSMLSAWRTCRRKFYFQYVEHFSHREPSIHLHAGAVYARGLEVLRKRFYGDGAPLDEAIHDSYQAMLTSWGDFEAPDDSPKSFARIVDAVMQYVERFPPHTDHIKPYMTEVGPAVEFTFALPLDENLLHPQTGQPILYCGRFDMLSEYNGSLFVLDDKTASQLGGSWAKQWRLRPQFTGYVWGASQYGFPVAGAIIRGCALKKTATDFAEAITYRPTWHVNRWWKQAIADIRDMIRSYENSEWPFDEGDACTSFGGCSFLDLCDKQDWTRWVEPDFVRRPWNPLAPNPEDAGAELKVNELLLEK